MSATTSRIEASVSHLIIFNPDLKPPSPPTPTTASADEKGEKDKDLEDDLKEASQILFYTSRQGGRVSRDTMLRQFGLAKGLMGFTDMLLSPGETGDKSSWWGVHSHKSRMIIWTPEEGFYIYLNVTLASETHGDTVHTSQGTLDQMIVDGLKRGYEDFRLLHGPLPSLMPPSSSSTSILERFWTKFSFQFETTYLSPSDPGNLLSTWIGGHAQLQSENAASVHLDLGDIDAQSGLIEREGPRNIPFGGQHEHEPLVRFLTQQLHLALPPPPAIAPPPHVTHSDRSSLGLTFGLGGRKKKPATSTSTSTLAPPDTQSRSTSWTAWVPGMGNTAETGPSATEVSNGRWPSFGLGGMGSMFGLGNGSGNGNGNGNGAEVHQTQAGPKDQPVGDTESQAGTAQSITSGISQATDHHVEQSEVALPDLQAAVQPEDEIELSWDKKDVWLCGGKGEDCKKRRIAWIIREETLLFLLYPPHAQPPYPLPTTSATLALLASRSPRVPRPSGDSGRPTTPTPSQTGDGWLHHKDGVVESHGPIESGPSQTLAEMRDRLTHDSSLHEIYAKTSLGKFVVAKRTRDGSELYLQVNRKDATLTDAEHALRATLRVS